MIVENAEAAVLENAQLFLSYIFTLYVLDKNMSTSRVTAARKEMRRSHVYGSKNRVLREGTTASAQACCVGMRDGSCAESRTEKGTQV